VSCTRWRNGACAHIEYGQAVEQLGHDKAAAGRLGGLYALERLAQDHPHYRQTVADVVCAYLRMPFQSPQRAAGDQQTNATADVVQQELQVRLTAQRLLCRRLTTPLGQPHPITYWSDIDIDLTGAFLIDFADCRPAQANFKNTQFSGRARFCKSQFIGDAWFEKAQFSGKVSFHEAQFNGFARFDEAQFSGDARFDEVEFGHSAILDGAIASHPNDNHVWPSPWRTHASPPSADTARLVRRRDGNASPEEG
jgi:hypothetical protein